MKEIPRFIIAYDRAQKIEYIIHTHEPAFIAKVIPSSGDIETVADLAFKYPYGARTNRLNGTFYIIPVIKFFNVPVDLDSIPKLMSRMGDWYYSVAKERSANEHH